MKRFISNRRDIYMRITDESASHYVCGNYLFAKADVVDLHPLDEVMAGKYVVHVVPFYN